MPRSPCASQSTLIFRTLVLALAALLCLAVTWSPAAAQQTGGGTVAGKVTDEGGAAVSGADVTIEGTRLSAQTGGTGDYDTASGTMSLHARNDKGTEYDFTYEVNK